MMNNTTTPAQNRAVSRAIGLLFLLPFLAYGFGSALVAPAMSASPAELGVQSGQMVAGGLMMVLNSIIVAAIGVMIFAVLEQHSRTVAVGYLAARILEALTLLMGIIALLTLSQLSDGASISEHGLLRMIAFKANLWSYSFAMIFLSLGSLPFCWLLLRKKLIPSGLSMLGIVGYSMLLLGSLLDCLGSSVGLMLSLPGGLFELAIGIWLMVKGFVPLRRATSSPLPSAS